LDYFDPKMFGNEVITACECSHNVPPIRLRRRRVIGSHAGNGWEMGWEIGWKTLEIAGEIGLESGAEG
jgi:hypothetical protein